MSGHAINCAFDHVRQDATAHLFNRRVFPDLSAVYIIAWKHSKLGRTSATIVNNVCKQPVKWVKVLDIIPNNTQVEFVTAGGPAKYDTSKFPADYKPFETFDDSITGYLPAESPIIPDSDWLMAHQIVVTQRSVCLMTAWPARAVVFELNNDKLSMG